MSQQHGRRLDRLEERAGISGPLPRCHVLMPGDPEPANIGPGDHVFELVVIDPPARDAAR